METVILCGYCGKPVGASDILFSENSAQVYPVAGQGDGIGHIDKISGLISAEPEDNPAVEDKIGYQYNKDQKP